MGVIRGILVVFFSILFFVSVLSAGVLLTVSSSLKYDNVKTEFTSLVKDFANFQLGLEDKINSTYFLMEAYCSQNSEYILSLEGYTIVFPCEVILQGSDAIVSYGSEEFLKQIYYGSYDCNFWDCMDEGGLPVFLISEKARIYWTEKFYFLLSIAIFLAVLMFLLAEKRANLLILVGIMIIVASLPLMKLSGLLASLAGEFSQIVRMFFSASFSVFLRMIILGAVILIAGIILKIFHIALKFHLPQLFSRKKKEEKTEAVQKEKVKKK